MQRFMLCSIFFVLSAFLIFTCSVDNPTAPQISQSDQVPALLAKKPAPNLIGEMDLYFELLAVPPDDPVWVGTITFEEYGTFGMRFFHLSPFRDYSQASPFEEYFEIYDDDEIVVLAGPDVGVTTLANKPPEDTKYRMNGEIEVAEPPFEEEWLGRKVHMSGVITWEFVTLDDGTVTLAPATAPGTFRIN
jgi:hypothetical protein